MALRPIIIGAGAAGLGAARVLKDAGHMPIVLEARDRIGGRAWSRYDLGSHPVEMGAEFIHGTKGATWQLLHQYGLGSVFAYRNHGPEVLEHLDDTLRDQASLGASSFFDVAEQVASTAAANAGDQSVAAVLNQALGACLGDYSDAESRLYGNTFTVYVTEDLEKVGVRGIRDLLTADPAAEPDPNPDRNFRVAEGYSALWDRLSEGIDVRLGTEVRSITWDGQQVSLETSAGVIEGDAAIVTLPLGVLKSEAVRFSPPLPEEKLDAIAELGAGVVNKIILEFEEPFWPEQMGLLFTNLDSQCFWPSGAGRETSTPLLTWWTSGSMARRVAEDVPRAVEGALADLQQIFARASLPPLRSVEAVCWGSDPYAQMAYSYVPVSDEGKEIHDALARPVGSLFFAGEATTRPPASASVPGAFESGRRAARELLEAVEARSAAAP